jgi:hypothetical protein
MINKVVVVNTNINSYVKEKSYFYVVLNLVSYNVILGLS